MYPYSDIANSLPEGTSPWPIQKWPASPSFSPKSGRHDLVGHLRQSADLDEGGWELMVRSIQRVFWRIFSYRNYPRKKKRKKNVSFSPFQVRIWSFYLFDAIKKQILQNCQADGQKSWTSETLKFISKSVQPWVVSSDLPVFLGSKPGWLDLSGVFIYSVFCLTHTKH